MLASCSWIFCLHLYRTRASSRDRPTLYISPATPSHHDFLGGDTVWFLWNLRHQKTRVPGPGLSCGILCVILRLAVSVEHLTCDRQTHDYGIYCASMMSRSKDKRSLQKHYNLAQKICHSVSHNHHTWGLQYTPKISLMIKYTILRQWNNFVGMSFITPHLSMDVYMPSVLWRCWLGDRKGNRPVKTEWWGTGMVICLERGANDLHVVPLMPLPPSYLWLQ